MRHVAFSIVPAPPFRLDLTVWALRRRPDNQVDDWDGEVYRRALAHDGKVVEVAVAQTGLPDAPRLEVIVYGSKLITLTVFTPGHNVSAPRTPRALASHREGIR